MEPIPVSTEFSRVIERMFPSADWKTDWRVENHLDGRGDLLVHWAIDAPIPTPEEIEANVAAWEAAQQQKLYETAYVSEVHPLIMKAQQLEWANNPGFAQAKTVALAKAAEVKARFPGVEG